MRIQTGLMAGALGLALIFNITGCRKEEPECIPSGKVKVVEVEKTPIPNSELNRVRKHLDQCHACVLSKKGFYSCQTVWQTRKETREELKKMAREKACADAGYDPGQCPDEAVKLSQCKGDVPTHDSELAKSFRRMMVRAAAEKTSDKKSAEKPVQSNAKEDAASPASSEANKPSAAPGKKFQPEVE